MKKQKQNKLSLDRETLVSLQPAALDAVNGGNAVTRTWTCDPGGGNSNTCFLCMPPPVQ